MEGAAPADIRLLFPDGRQEEFWHSVNNSAEYDVYVREIRAEGERLLSQPIPELSYSLFSLFERNGSRLEYEKVYFERRRRLNTMALLSQLEPENAAYREALHNIIWSICNEYTWCLPAHLKDTLETDGEYFISLNTPEWGRKEKRTEIDLFSAETGFALSEILRLTENSLPRLLRSRIIEEVTRRLFKPYLLHGPYKWESAKHNWSAVCAGSIGSAALLLLEDADQLAIIIEKALDSMNCYLAGFREDGACLEGVGYWNYGFGFYVYFADLLKKRTQGAIDLFGMEKVRQIALFQQKCYLGCNLTVNFSDSVPKTNVQIGLSHYLANTYPDVEVPAETLHASYTEDHCSRWAPAFRNLIWFDPQKKGREWGPADYYLSDAQWLVSRHVSESGRYGMAAKGGNNGEPHNHNDIGQFILACDGQAFVADLGSGEYTDKYFGAERYTFDCNGSQGHSVPIVDGHYQTEGAASEANVIQVSIGQQEDILELDLSKAYRLPHLSALKRRFTWQKTGFPLLLLEDVYTFTAQPRSIVERIVTQIEPRLESDGCVMLSGNGGRRLLIRYDTETVKPGIGTRSYRDHFGRESAWYSIDFSMLHPEKECKILLTFQFL
jgi:hypothetical protein